MDFRREQILNLVNANGYMTIEDLCMELNASQSTLRTDLDVLDKDGKLIRLRGVAISNRIKQTTNEKHHGTEAFEHLMEKEKKIIANQCMNILHPRESIFLDASSTCYILGQALSENTRLPLTVITNSLEIFWSLRQSYHINTVLIGGDHEISTKSLVGEHAIRFVQGFRGVSYAFISAWALDPQHGIIAYYSRNISLKKAMIANAEKTVILSDHSKFDNIGAEILCSWDDVDHLITDLPLPDQYHKIAQDNKVNVISP